MKRLAKDLSIRLKLMLIATTVSGAALLVSAGVFGAYDYVVFRTTVLKDLVTTADLIGQNCTAAINFRDAEAANDALRALNADSTVVHAGIFTLDGHELGEYRRDANIKVRDAMDTAPVGTARFSRHGMIVARKIELDGEQIGVIRIATDQSRFYARLRNYAIALALLLTTGMAVTYVMVRRLQRLITGPVLALTDAARNVIDDHDYVTRATVHGDDELGMLTRCFNEMLAQIQARDAALEAHRDQLEAEVAKRTEELRLANEELSVAKDRAEAASRAKSDFLANMSHEIRTPMTAILGYADLMLSPTQTMSDRVDSLQVVRRNARHLMDLVNDILDISKIEAGRMTIEAIPCDVAQIAAELVSMMRPKALAKSLTLGVEFVGAIPASSHTDPTRLRQVLINLTSNAIKFTDRGGITLRVRVEPRDNSSDVIFEVCDTGIGLTEEQIDKLFRPFVQADESMTRKYGGTGLGLAISKRLAALMNGDLTIESKPGCGSKFILRVDGGPLAGVTLRKDLAESVFNLRQDIPDEQAVRLDGRILLAEDGIDNQHLLMLHLVDAGAHVVLAENGRIALERLKSESFDVVLMDMQMPELDGYAATTQARRLGFTLPIIALTAHAMSGDRAKCLEAGCSDYLTKPIDKDLLLRTVSAYLPRAQPAVAAEPKPVPPAPVATPIAALLQRAVAGFVSRLPERVCTMRMLLEEGNIEELRRMAHQLKGAGGGYGFPRITELAADLEKSIKAAACEATIRVGLDALIDEIRAVEGYEIARESEALAGRGVHA